VPKTKTKIVEYDVRHQGANTNLNRIGLFLPSPGQAGRNADGREMANPCSAIKLVEPQKPSSAKRIVAVGATPKRERLTRQQLINSLTFDCRWEE